ncbi:MULTISPECIES: ABC transporter substrate-binding protein [Corynebacterium]|uniref:ABC transporter substrate-binding protein n=1 Tax=Corynebacterium TaxID=1716 RepID=UPI0008A41683|nr:MULTISPECIES: ABC transporter substrate-binding protein [Corynebacterium]OFT87587.1 hypothetical protein HMPREF3098_09625 [Corynebacterium sp. HMSC28B08]
MLKTHHNRVVALTLTAMLGGGALVACGSNEDPLANGGKGTDGGNSSQTITVGSANFPESEIVGQIYTIVLKDAGMNVSFKGGIGARDVYLKALEKGDIDVVPEYSGNVAQFYAKGKAQESALKPGASPEDVTNALQESLPNGIEAGPAAQAESKDSYRVTKEFSEKNKVTTLEELAKYVENKSITMGGNPELKERPYGPKGLESEYGMKSLNVNFRGISDGGGPLTVTALANGDIDVADIYTTSPVVDKSGKPVDVVELKDPKRLILAQQVLPLYRSAKLSDEAKKKLEDVQKQLTTEDLKAMNERNSGAEKAEPEQIAQDWLESKGLAKK